jgi:hypothetical protein
MDFNALLSDMKWQVLLHSEFQPEFDRLPADIQDELLARLRVLGRFGPNLGRPHADTLQGSRFANMKELRFRWMASGVSHSRSIPGATRLSYAAATRKAGTPRSSTAN